MNPTTKKIIAISISCVVIWMAYYGSYLPFQKSRNFIETMRNLGGSSSLSDFKSRISGVLDRPSPIGQEELVRQTANLIAGFFNQPSATPDVIADLMGYLESYYKPMIDQGSGMSFGQDLYLLGSLNELAFVKTNQKAYFDKAKSYYSLALVDGPKRPQALYGMFDIYRLEKNVAEVKTVSDQILSQWPNDSKVKNALADFLKQITLKKK
ncbi:MAG: hypothetical protein WCX12_03455 [Candidatus Paceibacterota bacterium]|jgi:hypothetical protein